MLYRYVDKVDLRFINEKVEEDLLAKHGHSKGLHVRVTKNKLKLGVW